MLIHFSGLSSLRSFYLSLSIVLIDDFLVQNIDVKQAFCNENNFSSLWLDMNLPILVVNGIWKLNVKLFY